MHWFPFYSSDFLGATVGLSCQERSLYALMIPLYFECGHFPVERIRVYRIVGCESDEQKRSVDFILDNFFVEKDDGWYQERAEKVKVEQAQVSAQARDAANKRWGNKHNEINESTDADALREHSAGNASHNQSQSHNQILETEPERKPEKKKVKVKRASQARASRLPSTWYPDENLKAWAQAERPDLDLRTSIASFVDYWTAVPGSKGEKLDWEATFRNWIRRESRGKKVVKDGFDSYLEKLDNGTI